MEFSIFDQNRALAPSLVPGTASTAHLSLVPLPPVLIPCSPEPALSFLVVSCHCHSSAPNLQWVPSPPADRQGPHSGQYGPPRLVLLTPHSHSPLLFFTHPGHLAVPRTFQAHFLLRAFALAVSSACAPSPQILYLPTHVLHIFIQKSSSS